MSPSFSSSSASLWGGYDTTTLYLGRTIGGSVRHQYSIGASWVRCCRSLPFTYNGPCILVLRQERGAGLARRRSDGSASIEGVAPPMRGLQGWGGALGRRGRRGNDSRLRLEAANGAGGRGGVGGRCALKRLTNTSSSSLFCVQGGRGGRRRARLLLIGQQLQKTLLLFLQQQQNLDNSMLSFSVVQNSSWLPLAVV